MAGFRNFVTGEILTAANVDDFLMKQTVQKYADAAARDAALGTAVAGGNALREGMVSYLDDENEVQYFDGTAWDAISQPIAGIGSNVVQTVKSDTFTTSSGSYAVITGLTVTITPSTATSKILLMWNVFVHGERAASGDDQSQFSVFRNATNLIAPTSPGSRTAAIMSMNYSGLFVPARRLNSTQSGVFLDSPATTSPVTYDARVRHVGGSSTFVNRTSSDTDNSGFIRGTSAIVAIEVEA